MEGKIGMEAMRYERRGTVALLIMALRPVNTLTAPMRAALGAGLQQALADPEVQAVVLCSDIANFSAGADFSEPGASAAQSLAALCVQIERSPKPIVAALNGKVLGAGLELALAAHQRVALSDAALGLPDVTLGSVPGAGGTQRLARLVGAQTALRLLLDAHPITGAQALTAGLVDSVVQADLPEAAIAAALRLALTPPAGGLVPASERREGLRDGKSFHAAVVAARARLGTSFLPAPHRAVDCVEAAQLLSPEQGLAYEAAAQEDLVQSPQAQGLRHIFFAERRAGFAPRTLASPGVVQLHTLGIWGSGQGVAELVVQALAAGLRVSLVEPSREALSACLSRIATLQERAVSQGRQSAESRDADWARLQSVLDPAPLATADLIVASAEAGPVPLNAASAITLGALPARTGAGRISLVPAMAWGLVAELCHTPEASATLAARAMALGRMLGWRMVFTGPGGPIEARLRAALSAAIAGLEAKGVARAVIAASLGSFGIGVGSQTQLPVAPNEAPGVLRACLAALANQGARLVAEAVARRPSDVDTVAVLAGLFPRWQGGPMFHADREGLLVMRADLRHLAEAAPQIYAPNPLWDELIAEGRSFATLNRAD